MKINTLKEPKTIAHIKKVVILEVKNGFIEFRQNLSIKKGNLGA